MNCIYVRTSTTEQGESITNQLELLRKYCKDNSISIAEEYIDEHTATTYNRPAFIEMLSKCGLKYIPEYDIFSVDNTLPILYHHIYIKHSSRFSREISVLQIYELLLKNNVIVHFIEEGKDTTNITNSTDNFIFGIQSLINANLSRETSYKVHNGMKAGAMRGKILLPSIYGYRLENNKLIPIPEEVQVIQLIFDLYTNEGMGFLKISKYLNDKGIKTKKGCKWCSESIRTILTQEKYIGISTRNKQMRSKLTKDTKIRIRDKEEWISFKYGDVLDDGTTFTAIPPVIDEDIFYKAQNIINSRRSAVSGAYHGKTLLSSKIICSICGDNYVSSSFISKGISHKFYVCHNKKRNGVNVCNNTNMQLWQLEENILNSEYVNSCVLRNKLLRLQVINGEIKSVKSNMNNYTKTDLKPLTETLVVLERKKSKLVDLLLDNTISKDAYKIKMSELDMQIDDIKVKIDNIENANTQYEYELRRLYDMKNRVAKTRIDVQYDKEEIARMIERIEVRYNTLTVHIRINGVEYVDELTI